MNHHPPNPDQETDPLDDLLRRADPGLRGVDVQPLDLHWQRLSAARRVRRRVAAAAFGLLVAGSVSLAVLAHREGRIAEVNPPIQPSSVDEIPVRKPPDGPKIAANEDSPANHGRERGSESLPAVPEARPPGPEHADPDASAEAQEAYAATDEVRDAVEQILQHLETIDRGDAEQWQQLVLQIRGAPPAVQASLVARLANDAELPERRLAMRLVVDASGRWADALLVQWLNSAASRKPAWDMLLARTPDENLGRLVPLANQASERKEICRRMAQRPGGAAAYELVRLAPYAEWRPVIAAVSDELGAEARGHLLIMLRDGTPAERAAAGFVIATLPGAEVDRHLAEMIARGRLRQAAYLALLARRTPAAQQFLQTASRNPELAPALHSAQYGWQRFGPITLTWLSELEEKQDGVDSADHPHDGMDRRIVAGRFPAGSRPAAG